ncbi:MAG: hypothetical protein HOD11_13200 [Candidatus Marinimicrobia bacterium]|jgi:hypothetical protein|nr:hypothetical protein [Candidatus Neomarinimicrobiota bacterium]MBT4419742.1 hypothetical protein [Candidatus Neomarinimicrobiota bacterium]
MMQAHNNIADPIQTQIHSLRIEETELIVLVSENGFLVVDMISGEEIEVHRSVGGLSCACFFAQVAPESKCEHIKAVESHHNKPDLESQFTQADADTYLSRVAKIDSELELDIQSAQQQADRINLWLESRKQKLEKRRNFYTFQLQTWMELNAYSTKQLVNGTLKMRHQPFQINIIDEDRVINDQRFCRLIPEKLAVDKKALRKHITETGEIVDGVEVNSVQPKFSYQLTTGGS